MRARAGNERPCQMCIRRGMNQACYYGLRKKPKYLKNVPGASGTVLGYPSAAMMAPEQSNTKTARRVEPLRDPGRIFVI